MSDNQKINYMDIAEFQSEGYLQEVNRQFLHPLGLALEVRGSMDEAAMRKWLVDFFDRVPDGPDHIDVAVALLKEFGIVPGGKRLFGVWDYRDDPEGIQFDPKDWEDPERVAEFYVKAAGVARHAADRRPTREEALGFWVQEIPDPE
jgi:hypothetical protein